MLCTLNINIGLVREGKLSSVLRQDVLERRTRERERESIHRWVDVAMLSSRDVRNLLNADARSCLVGHHNFPSRDTGPKKAVDISADRRRNFSVIAFAACLVNPRFNRLRRPSPVLRWQQHRSLASGQERDASAFLPSFLPPLPCRGPQILLHYFGKGRRDTSRSEQEPASSRKMPSCSSHHADAPTNYFNT